MSAPADKQTEDGQKRLSCSDEELVGLMGRRYGDRERTRAAVDVKNTTAVREAVNHLASVIERASSVATKLTIVIAIAAVAQAVALIVSLSR